MLHLLFQYDILGFIFGSIALVVSIILHELAHGYVALANGDKTAKYAGRLSINPTRHFDMVGLFMLLFVGFGYAKPVPVNPNYFKRKRLGFFLVSIAGVSLNIILAFVFSLFSFLLNRIESANMVLLCFQIFCMYMSSINLILCFFNLLPIYPLDGYNLLESIFSFKNSIIKFLRNYGIMILIALVMLSVLVDMLEMPYWLDLLGMYLLKTSSFVLSQFAKLWTLIFG